MRLMHTPRCQVPDIDTKWDVHGVETDFENLFSLVENTKDTEKRGKRRRKKRRMLRKKHWERRYALHGMNASS